MIEQLKPQVAILDVNLPGMNGLLLTKELWPKNGQPRLFC